MSELIGKLIEDTVWGSTLGSCPLTVQLTHKSQNEEKRVQIDKFAYLKM